MELVPYVRQRKACVQTEIDWNADELRVHMAGTEKYQKQG